MKSWSKYNIVITIARYWCMRDSVTGHSDRIKPCHACMCMGKIFILFSTEYGAVCLLFHAFVSLNPKS